ncbi:MAG: amidohydrolase [Candidatus Paceibacterota bacterium]
MSILLKNVIFNDKETDLLVEGNLIKKISKGINAKAGDKIDCKGSKAIIPGLYNMHTHAAMSLLRGFADDMPLMDWLQNKIWPLEEKLSEDDVYWGSKLAFLEMVRTGTIFFNDMYFFPEASVRAAEEMGLRALIGLVVFGGSKLSNPKTAQANLAKFRKMGLKTTQFAIAPHAIYTVGAEELKWCAQFAQKEKILLHTHLSETNTEVEDCLKQNNKRPVQYLDSLGLLGGQSILAHSVYLDKKEKEILGQRGCTVINNQSSNFKLAVGEIMDISGLKGAGANITIGTDGASSNNNLDMMQEMKISALAQKHKQKDATAYPAKEVLQAATKNGAKAAGLNGGEIKEGKLADFVLLDLNKVPLVPGFNIESDIVYAAAGDTVSDVIINGQEILRDGFFVSENENLIKKKAKIVAHNLVSKR